jgi:hypothetical protein
MTVHGPAAEQVRVHTGMYGMYWYVLSTNITAVLMDMLLLFWGTARQESAGLAACTGRYTNEGTN